MRPARELGNDLTDKLWHITYSGLRDDLRVSLAGSLRDGFTDNLKVKLEGNLGDSIWGSLRDSLWNNFQSHLRIQRKNEQ